MMTVWWILLALLAGAQALLVPLQIKLAARKKPAETKNRTNGKKGE